MTKKRSSKRNRREKSPAMALRSSESKLQERLNTSHTNSRKPRPSSLSKVQPPNDNSLPAWSPWDLALHQQNLWFSSFSNMVRMQQQFTRVWFGLETSGAEQKR